MNILRLVAAEKEKKKNPSGAFKKLEDEAKKCPSNERKSGPAVQDKNDLKHSLSPMQYHVTQERGTERPFSGKHLRRKEEGVYTCIVCDNVLFHSSSKFEHVCGWPSFRDVIAQGKVSYTTDTTHGQVRVEATCAQCGSHLGHVFDDGPKNHPVRYCVNSASLEFKKHTTV
ncbi:DgyrCDS5389 [Dimorphilus gyrociliatus]|uniref:Peptide-methionine (R)-S-oxide reductase n=1 Tax=Dimorphilus gyrociliatus TaxID=2664684 RepID=A0A7I8VLE8_9ANNE|nr:DgyrCDS5389 [Dimorphilus gyrociliatus]